jgi:hypothetical protein
MPSRQVGVVFLCAWLAACDLNLLIVSPGAVVAVGGLHLALRPIAPFPQTVPFPSCPSVQPVVVRFEIVLSNARVDHDLDRLEVSFADRRGAAGTALTLTSVEIAERFGTTGVAAGRDRVIVIVLGVGCNTLTTGTIVVRVRLHDVDGRAVTLDEEITVGAAGR